MMNPNRYLLNSCFLAYLLSGQKVIHREFFFQSITFRPSVNEHLHFVDRTLTLFLFLSLVSIMFRQYTN